MDADKKVQKKTPMAPKGKGKKVKPDPDPFWELYGHRFSMIEPFEL
jgi:hypothetical protein